MTSQPLSVKVTLDCYNFETSHELTFPLRVLTLQAPDWTIQIGRSTSSGTGPRQAQDNAWYDSRVVSREHAELKANPLTGEVLIRDIGSMHGTHIHGRRLKEGVFEKLHDGDTVVFGAEVGRADDIFYPIQVVATYTWSKDLNSNRSHFGLDIPDEVDYDDEVDYSEEEVDDHESDGNPKPTEQALVNAINNFSVPESDISDEIISVISDDEPMSDQESPTTSPIGSVQQEDNKENENPPPSTDRVSYSARPIDQTSPALGDQATDDKDSDGDSYFEDSSIFDVDEEIQAHVGEVLEFSPEPSVPEGDDEFLNRGVPSHAPGLSLPPLGRPAREPSPSDAAMVKPADCPLSPAALVRTLPPPVPAADVPNHSPYQFTSSDYQPLARNTLPTPKSSSACAGHNSVLYEPFPDSFVQDTYFNYQSGDITSDCRVVNRPRHSVNQNFQDSQSDLQMEPAPVMAPLLATDSSTSAGRKRKACIISSDSSLIPDSFEDPTRQPADVIMFDPSSSLDLQPIMETVEATSNPCPAPAKKKVKKSKRDTGSRKPTIKSTVTKYVATALAGAALGAAGTIWGLVALPKDFFV